LPGVASGDKTIFRNAAYCAAKAASIQNVPVALPTIDPQHNGNFIADPPGYTHLSKIRMNSGQNPDFPAEGDTPDGLIQLPRQFMFAIHLVRNSFRIPSYDAGSPRAAKNRSVKDRKSVV
jgi:hypothetical protein